MLALYVALQEIPMRPESLSRGRQQPRQVLCDEPSQTSVRLVPHAEVVVAQQSLVRRLGRQLGVGFRIQLVVRLVKENPARAQQVEGNERYPPGNQDRDSV